MNKRFLRDKILSKLELFENDIINFKGGVREKLIQLKQTLDDDETYQSEKDDEVTMYAKDFEGKP